MNSVLLESPTAARVRPPVSSPSGYNYVCLLKESVDRFLSGARSGSCEFSAFRSVFFRQLQSMVDPPLEVIWFYAAVSYYESVLSKTGALDRVTAVRDLLQLILACSGSCSQTKSVALLAPVVSELYALLVEVDKSSGEVASKQWKKLRKEIDSLLEGLLGYICVCSRERLYGADPYASCVLPCFSELVQVWTFKRLEDAGSLSSFFPLVNDEVRSALGNGKCNDDYLAGIVVVEAFLLRLLFKFRSGGAPKPQALQELRIWAVGSITGIQNHTFLDILLRLLLSPTLPSVTSTNSKDEAVLREILYDSLLLVDYSFISHIEVEQLSHHLKSLCLMRLMVFHEAIHASRKNGNQDKTIAYTSAFARSSLPTILVKWITTQRGIGKFPTPNTNTPAALLQWLLGLEEQGVEVFDQDLKNVCMKLSFDEYKLLVHHNQVVNGKNELEDMFFLDNKGEFSDDDALDDDDQVENGDAFISVAHEMKHDGGNPRKRKEAKGIEGKSHIKCVKYKLHDNTALEYFSSHESEDGSSGSEVDNPLSDEVTEMEE